MIEKIKIRQRVSAKNKTSLLDSSFTIIYLTVILTSLLISLFAVQDETLGKFLISETSPIEIFSAIGYLLAFMAAILLQWKGKINFGFQAALIFLIMGLRELDFHDRFTTMGIMKSRFYICDTVPISEKIIGATILIGLAWITAHFFMKNYRHFLTSLQGGNRAAFLALNGICLTIISKLLDANSSLVVGAIEESMEMAIPYFFLSAMLLYAQQKKRKQPILT